MSKHSFKYNVNQRKFSLKFIIYLFILLDLLLFFNVSFDVFWQLIGWELFTFLGLLIGTRGQVRYRELVYDLIAIRQDPQYNDREELRGFKLARHIDHACIEWDLWYQEQQNKIDKKSNKKQKILTVKKKTKKFKEENIMSENEKKTLLIWDETVWKQFGYSLVAIWEIAMPMVAYFLSLINWHWVIILFIGGVWEIFGLFVWFYLHYIFKLPTEEQATQSYYDEVTATNVVYGTTSTGTATELEQELKELET